MSDKIIIFKVMFWSLKQLSVDDFYKEFIKMIELLDINYEGDITIGFEKDDNGNNNVVLYLWR